MSEGSEAVNIIIKIYNIYIYIYIRSRARGYPATGRAAGDSGRVAGAPGVQECPNLPRSTRRADI
jgi:hypothetical protein